MPISSIAGNIMLNNERAELIKRRAQQLGHMGRNILNANGLQQNGPGEDPNGGLIFSVMQNDEQTSVL